MDCCHNCDREWKNPYCHISCPDYIREKKEYDARMAAERKRIETANSVYRQKTEAVLAALRRHGKK